MAASERSGLGGRAAASRPEAVDDAKADNASRRSANGTPQRGRAAGKIQTAGTSVLATRARMRNRGSAPHERVKRTRPEDEARGHHAFGQAAWRDRDAQVRGEGGGMGGLFPKGPNLASLLSRPRPEAKRSRRPELALVRFPRPPFVFPAVFLLLALHTLRRRPKIIARCNRIVRVPALALYRTAPGRVARRPQ